MTDKSAEQEGSLFDFPCTFPIKVVGEKADDMEGIVREVLAKHLKDADEAEIKARDSSAGNFVSVTAKFTAESKEQLDAIYTDLSGNEKVKMVL